MSVSQITFPGDMTAADLAFAALVETFAGDYAYIAAGALTPASFPLLNNALAWDLLLNTSFNSLGELAEKPGKVDSKTSGLRTRKFKVAGARATTLELRLVGLGLLQKKYLESPAFSSLLATIVLRSRDKTRVIVFNGLKWVLEWSGESDGLYDLTLSTEFAGATDGRVYVYKDIPAVGILPGLAPDPFAAWDGSTPPVTLFPLRTTHALTLTCPTGFMASFIEDDDFSATLEIPAGFDGTIYLSLTSSTPGEHTGNISLAPATGDPVSVPLAGFYGDGTADYPYPVASAADLNAIRPASPEDTSLIEAHYVQVCDISLRDFGSLMPDWNPIGPSADLPFSGSYDGAGFSITDLSVTTVPSLDAHALFGHVTGDLRNIHLLNASVEATGAVGLLVGVLAGSAANCSVQGKITYSAVSDLAAAGAVAAIAEGALLTNCHADVQIYSRAAIDSQTTLAIGGAFGSLESASVFRCSATGMISGPANFAGGFAGMVLDACVVNNSFALVKNSALTIASAGASGGFAGLTRVSLFAKCFCSHYHKNYYPARAGGFFGDVGEIDTNTVSDCYYNSSLDPLSDPCEGVEALTTAQMFDPDTWDAAGFDYIDVWIETDGGYPLLNIANTSITDPENP